MTLIYQINRSKKRRNLAIKVAQGELEVQAPAHMSTATIDAFVQQKRAWIEKHLSRQQSLLSALPQRQWQTGEQLRWLGQPLRLRVATASRKTIERYGAELFVTKTSRSQPEREPRLTIIGWYKQQAQLWLDEFFSQWPSESGLVPQAWAVGDFISKWGHCSRKGELKFTWKLWLAPEWVVRNVVIHELCHLREFNHSKAFWQLVAKHSPDYQAAEAWLRKHGVTVLNAAYLDYVTEPA